jgi:uncharacterized protein (DUF2267 family)
MRRLMAAPSAGEYGNLPIADLLRICPDKDFVSGQANGARVEHHQTLEHFFNNVFRAVNRLLHDGPIYSVSR